MEKHRGVKQGLGIDSSLQKASAVPSWGLVCIWWLHTTWLLPALLLPSKHCTDLTAAQEQAPSPVAGTSSPGLGHGPAPLLRSRNLPGQRSASPCSQMGAQEQTCVFQTQRAAPWESPATAGRSQGGHPLSPTVCPARWRDGSHPEVRTAPKSPGIADPPPLTHDARLGRISPCDLYAAQGLFHVCEELDALTGLYK